jgi:putative hydrolase of the HAD superfamily
MLTNIKNYIFDLDNTLYSYKNGLFDRQLLKMSEFIMSRLSIADMEKADLIRDELYYECSSTMLGLMKYHDIESDDFFDFVDNIYIDDFEVNLNLIRQLEMLKKQGKNLYILTNASDFHTERVTKQLGLNNLFDDVFTLNDSGLIPKPRTEYFNLAKNKTGANYEESIFFEDSSHNLVTAKKLGMTTVLVHADDDKSAINFYENREIDYYVQDLESFFRGDYIATRK